MKLRKAAYIIAGVWMAVQVALLFVQLEPQGGDWGHYIWLAQKCFEAGSWYPMTDNILHSNYIFAPGLVNLLIVEAKLTNSIWVNRLLYLLMSAGLLAELAAIARKLFSERVALWTAIVYCLLYSNLFITLSANTELPFLFLCVTGVWLVLAAAGNGVGWKLPLRCLVAGILIGLANWIRPLGVLYLIVIALLLALFAAKGARLRGITAMACGFVLMAGTIGMATKMRTGYFNCQSTTGGFNLIMTANDKAFGGVDTRRWVDPSSTAYIQNIDKYNCFQRDSIWKARSLEWIATHPLRYAWLYVKKMPIILAEDSWSDQRVFPAEQFYYKFRHGEYGTQEFLGKLSLKVAKSIPYYAMMVTALLGMATLLRRKDKRARWMACVFATGMLLSCLFPVQPRYHYPFLWPMMIFAAWWLNEKSATERA